MLKVSLSGNNEFSSENHLRLSHKYKSLLSYISIESHLDYNFRYNENPARIPMPQRAERLLGCGAQPGGSQAG